MQEEKRTELHFDSVMAGDTALHQMECWGKFYFLTTCVCTQMEDCYFSWSSTSCQHVYAYKWRIVLSVEVVDLKMDWISFLCFCDNLALSGSFHWLLYGCCHVGSLYLPSAVRKLLWSALGLTSLGPGLRLVGCSYCNGHGVHKLPVPALYSFVWITG